MQPSNEALELAEALSPVLASGRVYVEVVEELAEAIQKALTARYLIIKRER